MGVQLASALPNLMNGDPAVCNGCGKQEPEITFRYRTLSGRKYRNHLCVNCRTRYRKGRRTPQGVKRMLEVAATRQRRVRQEPDQLARHILTDCRGSDKKRGSVCDLTVEIIQQLIADGCTYCGETQTRIGLDRIDNARGHSVDNVVAACGRCNYLRRDMPYKAWMMLVPAIRKVRESGAFENWDGFGRRRRELLMVK